MLENPFSAHMKYKLCGFFVLVLDRLQNFLPQMAQANESLRQQMEEAPAGFFNIESVEDAEKVIEMVRPVSSHQQVSKNNSISLFSMNDQMCFALQDVALVELEESDSSEEDEESSSSSSEEDSSEEELHTVTAKTLKLPGDRKRKANIQVLEKE